jgi:phosphoglycerate dehydrogenase-like enzyme
MNLLLLIALPEKSRLEYYDRLRERFPDLTIHLVDHHSKVDPYIAEADALITFGAHMSDAVLEKGTRLRWIQALGTGVDGIADRPVLRKDTIVTNLHGLHGDSMSEAAMMLMLALARQLPRAVRNQSRRAWERFPAGVLNGKTVGIFGVGAIATELAPRCKAFGMTVVGITSARRELPGFDRMVSRDGLVEAVRELDYLVLLTPYTKQTHRIVNAAVLGAMKRSAFLVNLARGGVVDEPALVDALRQGRIAGAALDVFEKEPLPAEHPLWEAQNVIITPHLGGFHDEYANKALPLIEHNLRSFLAGDAGAMLNVVPH